MLWPITNTSAPVGLARAVLAVSVMLPVGAGLAGSVTLIIWTPSSVNWFQPAYEVVKA